MACAGMAIPVGGLFRRPPLGYDGASLQHPDAEHDSMAEQRPDWQSSRTCLAIVLAAGEGTRMRSQRPKVLHEIAGRSLLRHTLEAVKAAGGTHSAVVVGPDADAVAAEATRILPSADIFLQRER